MENVRVEAVRNIKDAVVKSNGKAIFNNIINAIESHAKNIVTISFGSCNFSDAILSIDELDLSNMDF